MTAITDDAVARSADPAFGTVGSGDSKSASPAGTDDITGGGETLDLIAPVDGLRGQDLDRQPEAEAGPRTQDALQRQLPAHQLHDLAGDGEAQARALTAPGHPPMGALERLEDARLILRGDALAGIADGKLQPQALGPQGPRLDLQADGAVLRMPGGIGEQVAQHLPQAVGIQPHGARP